MVICSGIEIRKHSINAMEQGILEDCITVSHALSTHTQLVMQCISNAKRQYATAVQTYISLQVQSVLTVHTGYVFYGTLVVNVAITAGCKIRKNISKQQLCNRT